MRLYYKAAGPDSSILHGIIDAKDIKEAASYLRQKGYFPITITEDKTRNFTDILQKFQGRQGTDVIFFTRQMASMLTAGLTLVQALTVLKKQVQNPGLDDIVQGLIVSIEEGKSFSVALSRYPKTVSPRYISLIKAAESSGSLDRVMLRLSENLEKLQKIKTTIRSAMIYPIIVLLTMGFVMMILVFFVIPQLSDLYTSLELTLPLPTQIVVGFSNILFGSWYILLPAIVFGIYYFRRWHHTQSGKFVIDKILLRVPLFGKLIIGSTLAEFTQTFGMLIGTGALVVDSLQKSAEVIGNTHYKNAVMKVSLRVEKGITIGDAMGADTIFPPMLVEMIKIGEQTGKLDESLIRVSEYFERDVEQRVKTLTTAMEPIIMLVLAVGVGFLIISVITPIYNLISAF